MNLLPEGAVKTVLFTSGQPAMSVATATVTTEGDEEVVVVGVSEDDEEELAVD